MLFSPVWTWGMRTLFSAIWVGGARRGVDWTGIFTAMDVLRIVSLLLGEKD